LNLTILLKFNPNQKFATGRFVTMAGPFRLAPDEVQGGIPTWAFGKETKVIVDCNVDGNFEMRAGGSPSETTSVRTGRIDTPLPEGERIL
jgi:hypothetical protein